MAKALPEKAWLNSARAATSRATEPNQPSSSSHEHCQARERSVEQRSPSQGAHVLERRREEGISGILLAEPAPIGQLHPLLNGLPTIGTGPRRRMSRIGELRNERLVLAIRQGDLPVRQRHD